MPLYKIVEKEKEHQYLIDKDKADKLINVGVKLSLVKEVSEEPKKK